MEVTPITIEQMQKRLGELLAQGAKLDHELWFETHIAGDEPGDIRKYTLPVVIVHSERGNKRRRILMSDEV